jgi:uncharacterized protein with von Willebrand factor type A (vWA) domain
MTGDAGDAGGGCGDAGDAGSVGDDEVRGDEVRDDHVRDDEEEDGVDDRERDVETPGEDPWRGLGGDSDADGGGDTDGAVPDLVGARDHTVDELVRFVRALRRAGADVPANAAVTAARALVEVGFDRERARTALRAATVTRRADVETFDRLFVEFWRRLTAGLDAAGSGPADRPGEDAPDGRLASIDGGPGESDRAGQPPSADDSAFLDLEHVGTGALGAEGADDDSDETATTSTYSPTGSRSPVEAGTNAVTHADVDGAMRKLTRALATLRGRRFTRGGEGPVDARRALRESLGTGGAVLGLPRTGRDPAAVRATVLADVSQSVLDVVDEGVLIEFLRQARARWRRTTVFFFDEDVREVSGAVEGPTAADALAALERAEAEWGGGTRIGEAVETVRRDHRRTVDRETVVVVISDGLEMGDPDDLAAGMAWLSRQAAAVLWLNPLAAAPDYEPVARGMAAALPYVDGLFAFAGPGDLEEIARQLRLRGTSGNVGYRQDVRRHRS